MPSLLRLARRAAALAAGLIVLAAPAVAEPGLPSPFPSPQRLDRADVARLIRGVAPRGTEVQGWAADILGALDDLRFEASLDNVCAMVAVIRQESSFTANPAVAGLGRKAVAAAEAEIAHSFKTRAYFTAHPDIRKAFLERLGRARTERDLDLAHRWLSGLLQEDWAIASYNRLANPGVSLAEYLEANNKVRTLGPMQVSVSFAAKARLLTPADESYQQKLYALRDTMYTRRGGIHYGAMQLLGYRADYPSRVFLFADYNAGRYSSRNAALQLMIAHLARTPLSLDGDLLAYVGGVPTEKTSETEAAINRVFARTGIGDPRHVHEDLLQEKTRTFTETWTYRRIRSLYEARTRKVAPYAIVPQIDLHSVKITRTMTTAIFANAVNRHYAACRALGRAGG